jgi:hypothetical protein
MRRMGKAFLVGNSSKQIYVVAPTASAALKKYGKIYGKIKATRII